MPVVAGEQYEVVIGTGGLGGGAGGAATSAGVDGGDTIFRHAATGTVLARFRGAEGGQVGSSGISYETYGAVVRDLYAFGLGGHPVRRTLLTARTDWLVPYKYLYFDATPQAGGFGTSYNFSTVPLQPAGAGGASPDGTLGGYGGNRGAYVNAELRGGGGGGGGGAGPGGNGGGGSNGTAASASGPAPDGLLGASASPNSGAGGGGGGGGGCSPTPGGKGGGGGKGGSGRIRAMFLRRGGV